MICTWATLINLVRVRTLLGAVLVAGTTRSPLSLLKRSRSKRTVVLRMDNRDRPNLKVRACGLLPNRHLRAKARTADF